MALPADPVLLVILGLVVLVVLAVGLRLRQGAKWECDSCGKRMRKNTSNCPDCGHTVFTKLR